MKIEVFNLRAIQSYFMFVDLGVKIRMPKKGTNFIHLPVAVRFSILGIDFIYVFVYECWYLLLLFPLKGHLEFLFLAN